MKVSFVIPAFNEAEYIGDTISSILDEIDRTAYTAEIIVVDNNSTDSTAVIANSYRNVKVIHEAQPGCVAARRAGHRIAQGEYIANIDADCVLPRGWLSRGLRAFQSDPKMVAISGPYDYYDAGFSNVLIQGYYGLAWLLHLGVRAIGMGSMIQGGNNLVERAALLAAGEVSDDFTFYGEDTELARVLAKQGKVKFDLSFKLGSSARRFHQQGLLRTGLVYTLNYFSTIFLKRPATRQWADYR